MPYGTVNADSLVSSDGGVISPNINSLRNRIINGAMVIDQRNAGASVSGASNGFVLDRWAQIGIAGGSVTVQRTTSVVPTGFAYAFGVTVGTAIARAATDYDFIYQNIEGLNVADLDLGLSTAATVTLSFWVRSSIAGLYSGVLASGDNNRTYGFTYTINAANTWEQKSVTIVGDTSGGKTAYPVDNTSGLRLKFDLGSGSNYQVTAGSWQAATNRVGVAGTVSWAQTAGATFYITGVQLEKGSTATSFDYRPYGTELALCQRYFRKTNGGVNTEPTLYSFGNNSQVIGQSWIYPVPMRVSPTATTSGTLAISNASSPTITVSPDSYFLYVSPSSGTAASVTYQPNGSYQISFSAEL